MDLAKTRMSFVGRGLSGTLDRLDWGIGYYQSAYRAEFNIKKSQPFENVGNFFENFLFDTGFGIHSHPFTLALGMDFALTDGSLEGFDFHMGLEVSVSKSLGLQVQYRPWPQERGSTEWAAGIKYIF